MEFRMVDAGNADLHRLTAALDDYYFSLVGAVNLRYARYNDPRQFAARIVAYTDDGTAVGCGCWKAVDAQTAEIKRIYILPAYRRQGIASVLIGRLERHAAENGCRRVMLETARTTADSAALYLKLGYRPAPYYGSPAGPDNCSCFEKEMMG